MSQDHPDVDDEREYPDIKRNSLHEVTKTSYTLGIMLGVFVGLLPQARFKNFNLYIIALSLFHFLEYYITAKYNPLKVHSESFLLNNGKSYMAAHSFAILECLIESVLCPNVKTFSYSRITKACTIIGWLLIILGQYTRTVAMHTAGRSFSHIVKTKKETDHVLVKTGIYSWSRHPSYFGFFWWAIGTQLLLLNPISLLIFITVLWKFFKDRICLEERYLIEFFGTDYADYKTEVSVGIPFVS
ncbi:farnesyl cysteine-carboxyl methyltransferase [Saccharomyces pastorianus]|uniref:Protein-S-isoprenylcysteine O-methyltransferase n=1 Tax=Saccharomyces pastorianus TaxID=27292 RepID=A0A6C1E400_SACPS|nr:farnesyl cysteine-carboxyl methyltransferase [Saccharomyces pastorianus]